MVRPSIPPPEKMRVRPLASLAQNAIGSMILARVESGRYNGRLVSIQRLLPRIEASEELKQIIIDEMWISALIASRNVAQFVTWGADEEGIFLAAELLQGIPLAVLRRTATIRKDVINDRLIGFIASELCAGLQATHTAAGADGKSLNLRHGYLNPNNIIITFRGEVKIAEFGLGHAERRMADVLNEPLGASQHSVYRPPPTGFEGNEDLYAWGVIVGELLTGRPPVALPNLRTGAASRLSEAPPNTAAMRRFIDPFFVDIARACIEQKPGERHKTAPEIAELFADWRAVRGFGEGDQESLARWAQNLGSPVQTWFRRASSGEFLKLSGAPKLSDVYVQAEAQRPPSVMPPSRSASQPAFSAVTEKTSSPDDRRAASSAPPPPLQAPPPPPSLSGVPSLSSVPSQASVPLPPISSRFTFVSRWAVGSNEESPVRAPPPPPDPAPPAKPAAHEASADEAPMTLRTGTSILEHKTDRGSTTAD